MIYAVLFLAISVLMPNSYFQASSKASPIQELCGQARKLLNEQKYSEAREIASKAFKIDARSAEALSILGQSEFALGNLITAEQHLTEALKMDPALTEARRALGATFIRQQKFESADGEFEVVLRSHPDDMPSLYGLGFSLLAQNKPSQALKPLVRAYHLNPSDPGILTGLLQVYLRLGQQSQAAPILADLNRQIKNDYSQQMQLAEVLTREGAYDLANNQFQQLLKARPDSYELNYDLALAYHRAGKEDQAEAQIHKMLAEKDDAELQNLLGAVEEKRGNYSQSMIAYRQAAQLQPGNEEFHLDYAIELALHWNPVEALKVFAAGVKNFPNFASMWMAMGGCYYLIGKYDQAAKALLQASQLAPDRPEVYALLGLAYDAAGPVQETIEGKFRDYIQSHPDDATARYFYGKILLAQSRGKAGSNLDDAQEELDKAIALNPALAQARIELATLLRMRGDFRAAQTQLEAAVKLEPESSEAYYQLMQVYRKLGQPQKAAVALRKLRRLKDQSDKNAGRKQVLRLLGGAER
jgi:tetratricopeptide (TPR) repeat protein